GIVRLREPPIVLAPDELRGLSPLLLRGTIDLKQSRFEGLLLRPTWVRLAPRERRNAASAFAKNLEQRGIHHGRVLAYKSRAIEADFGGVTFVDDAP
ncbi:MAG TPA: hypothetical protein VHZ95_15205, partial [Polyangiales bacterium]|nr:hypothetical protein [Polyangiales bacterium]